MVTKKQKQRLTKSSALITKGWPELFPQVKAHLQLRKVVSQTKCSPYAQEAGYLWHGMEPIELPQLPRQSRDAAPSLAQKMIPGPLVKGMASAPLPCCHPFYSMCLAFEMSNWGDQGVNGQQGRRIAWPAEYWQGSSTDQAPVPTLLPGHVLPHSPQLPACNLATTGPSQTRPWVSLLSPTLVQLCLACVWCSCLLLRDWWVLVSVAPFTALAHNGQSEWQLNEWQMLGSQTSLDNNFRKTPFWM